MSAPRRHQLVSTVAAAALATTLVGLAAAVGSAHPAGRQAPREADDLTAIRQMLVVGNNWDGTVDIIDPRTLERVSRVDVAPDFEEVVSQMTPDQQSARELNNEFAAEGHDQLVDDIWGSPDGRTLYVSRPSLGDVVAIDLASGEIRWRVRVSMYRPDHMALSHDGSELLVSATIAKVVHVIDTATGTIVDEFPTGDFPHENEYSEDGSLIFNGSIGRVITPDLQILDPAKGDRWFTIADAETHDVIKVIEFDRGVRPYVVMPDNRTMYVQLSFFHGFVEYDLQEERVLRTVELPLSEEAQQMQPEDYPLDSAHHGLAMNEDGTKICDAGTVSDYVAIITRATLSVDRIIPVGDMPYWATSSSDGEYCFVANSNSDDVSVISYDRAEEVARIPVGDHPQRMRMAPMVVPRLQLSVRPRRVERGERTRLRFQVRAATGTGSLAGGGAGMAPVAGATVRIGKKHALTGQRGFVTLRKRFRRRGGTHAYVDASGYAGSEVKIRVRKPR
jgi:YVTN family beta-propeller protein